MKMTLEGGNHELSEQLDFFGAVDPAVLAGLPDLGYYYLADGIRSCVTEEFRNAVSFIGGGLKNVPGGLNLSKWGRSRPQRPRVGKMAIIFYSSHKEEAAS